jgi:hypothetical protein
VEPFWFCDEARPKTSARRVTRKAAKDTRRMAMTTTSTGTFLPVPGPNAPIYPQNANGVRLADDFGNLTFSQRI